MEFSGWSKVETVLGEGLSLAQRRSENAKDQSGPKRRSRCSDRLRRSGVASERGVRAERESKHTTIDPARVAGLQRVQAWL